MTDNRLYIACLDLSGADVLVIGSDGIALEKTEGLLAADTRVTVVSPEAPHEGLRSLDVELHGRPYTSGDLDGKILVIVATEDTDLARKVHAEAIARSMLVNVADVPELCNFILPSIHRNGPLAIAVSTGGASPALGQRIRDEIAERYGRSFALLAETLRALRPWAKDHLGTYVQRRDLFRSIVNGSPDPIEVIERGEDIGDLVTRRKEEALARS